MKDQMKDTFQTEKPSFPKLCCSKFTSTCVYAVKPVTTHIFIGGHWWLFNEITCISLYVQTSALPMSDAGYL